MSTKTLIYNANIYTMNDDFPKAQSMMIENGKIADLFMNNGPDSFEGIKINAHGQTILPGFIDAHCHLNAMIADAFAFTCPQTIQTFDEFIAYFQKNIENVPSGEWIRINHFNPQQFHEQRLLSRVELDAISTKHPIRVRHVSRHVTMTNSVALQAALNQDEFQHIVGIKIDKTNGTLFGADAFLNTYVIPRYTTNERMQQVPLLHEQLITHGITAVHDATPTTTAEDLQFWQQATENHWSIHTQFMASYPMLQQGELQNHPKIKALKVVIEHLPELYPSAQQLLKIMQFAATHQLPIAMHAVTPEMIWMIIDCATKITGPKPPLIRIEHASLCPEAFIPFLSALNIQVVTNPNFIYAHGDRYLQDVEKSEHNWIYLANSLQEEGIIVAAGSDAPVATVSPFVGIYAATTRLTSSGQPVNFAEQLSRMDAIKLYTTNAARVTNLYTQKGQLSVGYDADFFFTKTDPVICPVEQLLDITASSTWILGKPIVIP